MIATNSDLLGSRVLLTHFNVINFSILFSIALEYRWNPKESLICDFVILIAISSVAAVKEYIH